ncbi:MAG: LLM class F420-dependent oxidoreductase [Acidimicrobiales bacterium]|nr:LLM class F420-dependent oxidoreductase [Acidimicrobiales bacterium]MDG2217559.1 LLM class F420-dependent oxidoreductase [Acidimicrobiales bacterium]
MQSARLFTSVSIPLGRSKDRDVLADRARRAEALGIDAVFVTDHPAPPTRWLESSGHPTLDPFVALSFIAAATTTLRVHTNLLVLPYRHPLATAKAVASLDSLSHGRLILGVGVGYLAEEFAALGLDVDERGAMMEDALSVMRQAWKGEPFGQHDTVVAPVPAQHPHPPIWVGGNSRAAMRRAVRFGQGWSPMPSPKSAASFLGTPGIESVAELGARIAMLHEIAAAEGRTDRLDVAVIPTSLSGFAHGASISDTDVLEEIVALRSVGATALVVSLPDDSWDDRIEWLANKVLAKI